MTMLTPTDLARLAARPGWPDRYALFAALRSGQPLPPDVASALADLLTQVAVTVDEANSARLANAPAGAYRGWLDVLGQAENKLMAEWTEQRGATP